MKIDLFNNLTLKLISLVIAVFLWFMVTGKDYRYGDFTIPIEIRGPAENLILVHSGTEDQEDVKNASVRVRATETVLRTVSERSMFLQLDISELEEGNHLVQLNPEMVMGKPPGAEITEITPRVLELDIEERLIKPFVMVRAEILGKPAEGYDIWQIRCDPPSVRVEGPRSVVEDLERVSTPQINVDGLTQSTIERSLLLVPPHPLVTMTPPDVTLRIRIGEKIISRTFRDVPVEVAGNQYVTRINPKTIDTTVQGPVSQIESLAKDNLRVTVRVTGDEPKAENIRKEPVFQAVPADSFPNIRLERFGQSYIDVFITGTRVEQ